MKLALLLILAGLASGQTYRNGASTREGPVNHCGTASGTGNAITCTVAGLQSYQTGARPFLQIGGGFSQ